MKKLMSTSMLILAILPNASFAYEKDDVIVRAGLTSVQPNNDGEPDNVYAENNTQVGLNIAYMATSNLAIELLASSPFKHDVSIKGVGNVGTTKHLPPTLSAQYYFNNASIVTPYLGAGINYTLFFDEKINGVGDIELKDSVGLALQAGADIAINDHWAVNVDIRKMDIKTEITSQSGSLKGTEVEIDPWIYSLTAAYKF